MEKFTLNKDLILAMPFRTSYSFINHTYEKEKECLRFVVSENPHTVSVFSSRDISKGDEIVSVYNLDTHIDILKGFGK